MQTDFLQTQLLWQLNHLKLTPKQRREQERLTKEENTKTANKVITDESQHMKNRIDNRHVVSFTKLYYFFVFPILAIHVLRCYQG